MTRQFLLLAASICCWAATVIPSSAQHLRQIPGSLAQVAAGRSEVWGLDASNQVYRFNSGTKTFAKVGTIRLPQVAVGGGTALQADQVWGITASGKIYRFSYKTNTFTQVPGILAQIVVGEGDDDGCYPYEVWGLSAAQLIYRYDSCSSQFVPIPGALTHIEVGGGDVWGLNAAAQIYHYSFSRGFEQVGTGSLQEIAVGVDGDVWGIGGLSRLYRYSHDTGDFDWIGSNFKQIVAGGNGFWLIDNNNQIWRYTPGGGGFVTVNSTTGPIAAAQVAVGYGAGVWVVDSSNKVYSFVRP